MNIATPNQQFFVAPSGTTTKDYPGKVSTISASATKADNVTAFVFAPRLQKIEKIPYSEGMALYYRIKQRHSDLFRELADL